MTDPTGYTYGSVPASPVTPTQLRQLLDSVMWTDDDAAALRRAGDILIPQSSAILDLWYGFVASTPHLVAAFAGSDGKPDADYLAAVRGRFERWISDLCTRDFDETWLAYQNEIALRHHTDRKNRTDEVDSPVGHVELRHLIALAVPVTVTIRDFLRNGDAPAEYVTAMHDAWFKAVTVSVALWSRPYNPQLW